MAGGAETAHGADDLRVDEVVAGHRDHPVRALHAGRAQGALADRVADEPPLVATARLLHSPADRVQIDQHDIMVKAERARQPRPVHPGAADHHVAGEQVTHRRPAHPVAGQRDDAAQHERGGRQQSHPDLPVGPDDAATGGPKIQGVELHRRVETLQQVEPVGQLELKVAPGAQTERCRHGDRHAKPDRSRRPPRRRGSAHPAEQRDRGPRRQGRSPLGLVGPGRHRAPALSHCLSL